MWNKEDKIGIEEGLIEFFNGKVQLSNQGIFGKWSLTFPDIKSYDSHSFFIFYKFQFSFYTFLNSISRGVVMSKIYNNITELIGNTPIVKLNHLVPDGAADVLRS